MIEITIRKKILKDSLAISKRATTKDHQIRLIGKEDVLFIHTIGENIEIYDYLPVVSINSPFSINIDPIVIDKWLDKADRDMTFHIEKEKITCAEKGQSTNITHLEEDQNWFFDARIANYKNFEHPELFLKAFNEANVTFYPYERKYADYAKLTNNNFFVYNPLITSIFFLREDLNMDSYNQTGIAIHQKAVDVIVKTFKNPPNLSHGITNKNFLLREQDTIFGIPLKTDISFPDIRTDLKALPGNKYRIDMNAEEILSVLEKFDLKEVSKVTFDADKYNKLIISTDNNLYKPVTLNSDYNAPKSVFSLTVAKAFFEGLVGEITIGYSDFNSNSNQGAYLWKFQDKQKSKIIPGIKEAPGFKQKRTDL